MKTVYKGWELLKEVAEGNIKEGTEFYCSLTERVVYYCNELYIGTLENRGYLLTTDYNFKDIANADFELIEKQEEINIQNIEELDDFDIQGLEVTGYSMTQPEYLLENGICENRDTINEIIKVIKQIDNKIEELKKSKANKGEYYIQTNYDGDGDKVNKVYL